MISYARHPIRTKIEDVKPSNLRKTSLSIRKSVTPSRRVARTAESVRFFQRAAPALLRRISEECKRDVLPAPLQPNPKQWPDRGLHAAWIGHSSVLLKIDGFSILTDPVFSTRIGLNLGPLTVGIKRLVEPAASLQELPPVDLLLLSHAHMDHFDLPSLRQLESRRTHVVTAYRTSDLLRRKRYLRVHELGWNDRVRIGPVAIKAFEVAHWGARMRSDVYRGYNGYVLQTERHRIVFGGDTAYTHSFKRLRASRKVDLAIMPIGAYDPWIHVHCNPEQAWRMANDAGAEFVLPVHHQTFELSRESYREPIERILQEAGSAPERICVQQIGQEFHL
ncbi:MAG: MBL fold metallo-hydrolase [Acidobacteriaceae bacterium]|nr:MBL fold metallo-hydrolase [Acidobacteriaceae bacterium]MBV9781084.1 MBL fold metallo-hydrolase [Acidobacteriaceae bacterium]